MRNYLLLLATGILFAPGAGAQSGSLRGRWILNVDIFGTPNYSTVTLEQNGEKLTGTLQGEKLEGSLRNGAVHFQTKSEAGSEEVKGTVQGDAMTGSIVVVDAGDEAHAHTYLFTAQRVPERREGSPQHYEFEPTTFSRFFSAKNKPVLTIWPGDSVHTNTVDAGGTDYKGVERVMGGNPQTGPFYVQTAAPGDILVIHLNRVRLNRDWAISDDEIVPRGVNGQLAVRLEHPGKEVIWHLDREHGVASVEKPGEHLTHFTVPMRPMLGCVGVAEDPGRGEPRTGDSGSYGGNMDFNEVVEGATVYLPVKVPGALLYVGDAHAAQGDGELTGDALETSMDVEFTVDVIPGKHLGQPRVESPTKIMAMGFSGSIDDSFQAATENMSQWLSEKYKLTPSEIIEVLGMVAEYHINEVADRNAGVALEINKDRLQTLTKEGK